MAIPNFIMAPVRDDKKGWVIPTFLGGAAFLYFGYLALLPTVTSRWLDFTVYWEASQKALLGHTVYDVVGHFQYKYSPLIALLFGKFFQTATFEQASFFFQKAMLLLWVALFLRFARRDFRVLFVLLLFFGNALRLDLELGQINALVLYLLVLLFGAIARPRSWAEDLPFGILFSFVIQLKLFALVLVPLLLIRREWRKLGLGLFFLPLMSIGGVAIEHGLSFAISENHAWMTSLFQSTDELLLSVQNVAMLGIFSRYLGLGFGKVLWLSAGIGFCIFLWKNRERPVEWFQDWLLYGIAIFNPLVWSYWILFAISLFASRLSDFQGAFRRRSMRSRMIGALATLLIFAAFNGQHARWAWSGGIFLGLVLLGVATFRVRAARVGA
jgi:hypothetical protein